MSNIDREIRMAISTGKIHLGSKTSIKEIHRGRAKLVILSSNCPQMTREKIENYCNINGIPVLKHSKNSLDLGLLSGKPFPVSAIVINDLGDSKILTLV